MRGLLIAFEGLDQSGKQTQAERLKAAVEARGRQAVLLDFPSYETHIGKEIGAGLHGQRDYAPDTMQLLYVANRYEKRPHVERLLAEGAVVICDRYLASSVAYGEAHGLDGAWLRGFRSRFHTQFLSQRVGARPQVPRGRFTDNRDRRSGARLFFGKPAAPNNPQADRLKVIV